MWGVRLHLLVGLCLAVGCASWSHTRSELVDPIHELLHHTYPHAYANGFISGPLLDDV